MTTNGDGARRPRLTGAEAIRAAMLRMGADMPALQRSLGEMMRVGMAAAAPHIPARDPAWLSRHIAEHHATLAGLTAPPPVSVPTEMDRMVAQLRTRAGITGPHSN